MKRKKGIKIYFKYCLIALMTIVSINSCKKESQSESIDNNEVQQLKTWFKSNIDHTSLNRFESMEPDWDNIHLTNDSTQTVYEVTLNNPNKVGQTQGEFNKDKANNYIANNNIRLLIFKNKITGNFTTGYYMSVVNSGRSINLENIHYKQVEKLNGTVLFYDTKGIFTNGWLYKEGEISRQISLGTIDEYKASQNSRQNTSTSNRGHGKLMLEDVGGSDPVQPVGSDGSVVCFTEGFPLFRTQCSGVDGYMNCEVVQYGTDYVTFCSPSSTGGGGGGGAGTPGPGTGGGGGTGSNTPAGNFMAKIDASKLKPCFTAVLNSLKSINNNCIANTLEVFSGEIPGYNWNMQDGSAGGNNGTTNSFYNRINGTVTTTFNSGNYTSGSDLAIAKTILHESVHAYLVAHFNIDQSTAVSNYPQYVDEYYATTRPDMNESQHNEIVRSFVGSIADQLKQYGQSRGYNLTDQFYNDLSWGGLIDTKAFKSFTPAAQDRIKDVILSEQSGSDTKGNPSPPKGGPAGC